MPSTMTTPTKAGGRTPRGTPKASPAPRTPRTPRGTPSRSRISPASSPSPSATPSKMSLRKRSNKRLIDDDIWEASLEDEDDDNSSDSDFSGARSSKRARKSLYGTTPKKTASRCGTPTKPRTPRTPRTPGTPRTPRTPRTMTPSIPQRSAPLSSNLTPIAEAQVRLHVSAVPRFLPCREDEFEQVLGFVESRLRERSSGCVYVSGVPGTGKTATVKEVVRTVQDENRYDFDFVEINGMRLTEPAQAYVKIWRELSGGQKATSEQACRLLEQRLCGSGAGKNKSIVLMVDELDMLWTRKQAILYNLFEWPTRSGSRLIVIAIANTMDLPERAMMNRVSSRLGLTRITFAPYTHDQLQEIVTTRLNGLRVFDADAVQLVARKVASLSGDARRALDICRRATEIAADAADQNNSPKKSVVAGRKRQSMALSSTAVVTMEHVLRAHEEMFTSPKVTAIRSCSLYQQHFLRAVVCDFAKSGIEETTLARVVERLTELLAVEGERPLHSTAVNAVCNELSGSRLIVAEHARLGQHMRIRLNVSQEDVTFALSDKAAQKG